jgi:ADP-ribose pyrophosphatase YjhB (NUDIX family)
MAYTGAMNTQYLFQYCQKLVVFSEDHQSVLFARRKGEADFDEYWSLIGGKLEVTDGDIVPGIKREKDEEVGADFHIEVAPNFSCYNVHYQKKDGTHMILPHYVAVHTGGEVELNDDEYSAYKWVKLDELDGFGPKVDNTGDVVKNALRLIEILKDTDFVAV